MKFPNSVPAESAGTLFCIRRLTGLLLLPMLALLLSGCSGGEDKADLVIINVAEPESLDPAIITGQPDMRVVKCLFEGLTLAGSPRCATRAGPGRALGDVIRRRSLHFSSPHQCGLVHGRANHVR